MESHSNLYYFTKHNKRVLQVSHLFLLLSVMIDYINLDGEDCTVMYYMSYTEKLSIIFVRFEHNLV